MEPAIRLYEAMGFTEIEPYVDDPAEGVRWFGWHIPAAPPPPVMPAQMALVRTTPRFGSDTVPAGLLRAHQVAEGVWGRLRVVSGTVVFVFDDDPDHPTVLWSGDHIDIPPQRAHHLEPEPGSQFEVEFHSARAS